MPGPLYQIEKNLIAAPMKSFFSCYSGNQYEPRACISDVTLLMHEPQAVA